jgi:hypothetical protein
MLMAFNYTEINYKLKKNGLWDVDKGWSFSLTVGHGTNNLSK